MTDSCEVACTEYSEDIAITKSKTCQKELCSQEGACIDKVNTPSSLRGIKRFKLKKLKNCETLKLYLEKKNLGKIYIFAFFDRISSPNNISMMIKILPFEFSSCIQFSLIQKGLDAKQFYNSSVVCS